MNKALLLIAAQMLELASEEFSYHSCNDLYLGSTSGNINFVKEMIAESDDPERTPNVMPAGTKSFLRKKDLSGTIFVHDSEVMDYCAKRIKDYCEGE